MRGIENGDASCTQVQAVSVYRLAKASGYYMEDLLEP